MIIIPNLKIGYQDLPKVASTSLFSWFYTCLYDRKYEPIQNEKGQALWVHGYFREGKCPNASSIENEKKQFDDYTNYYCFTLTRDPVKRFLSMYSNRVLHYREFSAGSWVASKLAEAGLLPDPDINLLVANLDDYLRCQPSIHHHARPMMDFLGPDLDVYDRLADISETDRVIEEIKTHWSHYGLIEALQRGGKLGREQTGGVKLGLEVVTPESFEKLLDYYREDYEIIPSVSLARIKEEYAKVMPASLHIKKTYLEPPLRISKSFIKSPNIQEIWFGDLPKELQPTQTFALNGVVLLALDVDEGDWKLIVEDANGEYSVKWNLPSPKMAKIYAGNPHATHARFRIEGLSIDKDKPVRFLLISPSGESLMVAKMTAMSKAPGKVS